MNIFRKAIMVVVASTTVAGLSTVPAVAENPTCKSYLVLGVRGSGEEPVGFHNMGNTVGAYAAKVGDLLPGAVDFQAVDYPASLVDPAYLRSVETGVNSLLSALKSWRGKCPGGAVGLIGYSQGAHVINTALHRLDAEGLLGAVRSVLLLADPMGRGGTSYAFTLATDGSRTNPARGGILLPTELPQEIQPRSISFCLKNDGVCDAEQSGLTIDDLIRAMGPTHRMYRDCCAKTVLPALLGEQFAERLQNRCLVTTVGYQTAQGIAIPDGRTGAAGAPVRSTIGIPDCRAHISPRAKITVHIRHTFCGDLSIVLHSPSGQAIRIKEPDETAGEECAAAVDFDITERPLGAGGDWTLEVRDHVRLDTGALHGWRLAVW